MLIWLLLPVVLGGSWCLTALLRRYALSRRLIDQPGARRSHAGQIPRGGGVAIATSVCVSVAILGLLGELSADLVIGLIGAGGAVTVLGFIDDHKDVPVVARLVGHIGAAAWALFWLGGFLAADFGVDFQWLPRWFINGLVLIYMVWLLNLFNFMDGIDGIASVEAVTVCIGVLTLYAAANGDAPAWYVPAILLAAVLGFIPWNFPRASIFLGDSGSGFLGIALAVLSIDAAGRQPELFWAWVILLAVFITDATVTLLRRLCSGERIHEAHRTHAYQHAAQTIGSHQPISLTVGMINIFWLAPVGLSVGLGRLGIPVGLALAYLPLLGLAVYFRAGVAERTTEAN